MATRKAKKSRKRKAKKETKVSCHNTLSETKAAQKKLRAKGKTATRRKNKKGYCVFTTGKDQRKK